LSSHYTIAGMDYIETEPQELWDQPAGQEAEHADAGALNGCVNNSHSPRMKGTNFPRPAEFHKTKNKLDRKKTLDKDFFSLAFLFLNCPASFNRTCLGYWIRCLGNVLVFRSIYGCKGLMSP
jgi:hypothetical protein